MTKRIIKDNRGFALVFTILVLAVTSILGVAVLGLTTSNYKITKIDSRSQSTYYIAEAGINYMVDKLSIEAQENSGNYDTSEEFFQYLENQFTINSDTLDAFEINNGEQPIALITVSHVATAGDVRDYRIESVGKIGDSTRTVNSVISLTWVKPDDASGFKDIFIYSPGFSYTGDEINGEGGTIVIGDITNLNGGVELNTTNIYIDGPAIDLKGTAFGNSENPGKICVNGDLSFGTYGSVYGDVYVKGTFTPGGANYYGDVYVDGDVNFGTFNYTGNIKRIYYTGALTNLRNLAGGKLEKVPTVPSFTIPSFSIDLKEDSWYADNGYEILNDYTKIDVIKYFNKKRKPSSWYYEIKLNDVPSKEIDESDESVKLFVDNFSGSVPNAGSEVVIISKGDISLSGWTAGMTGALIAPNGSVHVNQGYFTGVIISKNGLTTSKGGSIFTMKEISDIFPEGEMPIEISGTEEPGSGEPGSGEETDNTISIVIKKPIREE